MTAKKYTQAEIFRRRRIAVGGLAATIILSVAAGTAFVWPGFALPETVAELPLLATTDVQSTPTITPAPRDPEQTALVAALPDEVLGFVQVEIAGIAPNGDTSGPALAETGTDASDPAAESEPPTSEAPATEVQAIETWRITYADDLAEDANSVVAEISQFSTAAIAQEYFYARTNGLGEPLTEGDVLVGEEKAGRYTLFADPTDIELGVLYWRNGTVVIRATGALAHLPQFYSAFPI